MVTSHLGRPTEGELTSGATRWRPSRRGWPSCSAARCRWCATGSTACAVAPGQVVLLENCRFNKGEKKDDEALARKMAALCDIYVNDAFGTAHRAEATTHGIARFAPVACAGPLLAAELDALGRALAQPAAAAGGDRRRLQGLHQAHHPEERCAEKVDQLIVGGGIANTFMLAAGLPIGKSLCRGRPASPRRREIIDDDGRRAAPPCRCRSTSSCAKEFAADARPRTKARRATWRRRHDPRHRPADRGSATPRSLAGAGTIVWNGPVGVFEFDAVRRRHEGLAEAIAASPAFSIAGGGDTLAAIAKYGVTDRIGYISTGGGAFLEFLEGKTLPAVAVLESALRLIAARRARSPTRPSPRPSGSQHRRSQQR